MVTALSDWLSGKERSVLRCSQRMEQEDRENPLRTPIRRPGIERDVVSCVNEIVSWTADSLSIWPLGGYQRFPLQARYRRQSVATFLSRQFSSSWMVISSRPIDSRKENTSKRPVHYPQVFHHMPGHSLPSGIFFLGMAWGNTGS